MAANPCQVLDCLAAFQFDILRRINRKFAALRGLAQLLAQLINIDQLDHLLASITALVPIIQIDLSMYTAMLNGCPYLNLPPISADISPPDLSALQSLVAKAYADLYNKLLRHPLNRIAKLQAQMDGFQGQINAAFAQANDFLRCLQAICDTGALVASQMEAIAQTDIHKEFTKFTDNFVASAGQVITPDLSLKYAQVQEGQARLISLGADVNYDYNTAKAAVMATQTPPGAL